jgi:hypothetical protein
MQDELFLFGQELIRELNLQGQDAAAQGDRQTSLVLTRVSNAIDSLFARRAAAAEKARLGAEQQEG